MFAVLKTGGKQYKVAPNDVITVERIAADAGETVQFNEILMIGGAEPAFGAPLVADAGVQAEVVDQIRGEKLINFKRRRRKHSSARRVGHRQYLTTLRITDILAAGAGASGVKAAIGTGSIPKDERPALSVDEAAPAVEETAVEVAEEEVVVEAAAEVAEAPAESPAEAPAEEAPAAEEVEAARPDNLLDAPEGDEDDLTRISGVGPKLKSLLNENGVYHFRQIAAWGPAEIAYMDDLLKFKGRIERDEWTRQAAEFAAETDG
ncbi:MAG: 50S ribosomal protein L21 [Pseudomonadota bacterium]